jgi:putative oxidoreductase
MTHPDATDAGKLLLRASLGAMMLLHGVGKLRHGLGGIERRLDEAGLPGFIAWGVYLGEIVAPLLLVAGWKTRIAALVLAFNMLVAIALAHAGDVLALGRSGGWKIELPMLYLLGGVAVALLGAGRYSLSRGEGRWD